MFMFEKPWICALVVSNVVVVEDKVIQASWIINLKTKIYIHWIKSNYCIWRKKKPGRVSSWLECWLDLEEAQWSLPLPLWMGNRCGAQTVFHWTFRPWCRRTLVKKIVAPRLSESGCSLRPSWGGQPVVPFRPHYPPQPFRKYSLHAF